jgi:hypothetical protein
LLIGKGFRLMHNNLTLLVILILSIFITNSFVIFSGEGNNNNNNTSKRLSIAGWSTNVTSAIALTSAFVGLFYRTKKQPNPSYSKYYNSRKIQYSLCIFLTLWLVAQIIWGYYQQSPYLSIADVLWLIGYVFFGYFLFSLYNMLRKTFIQSHVVVLVSVIIVISLAYMVDLVVSTSQLLSSHEVAFGVLLVDIAYPILDGILLVPAVLILWSLLSGTKQEQGPKQQQQEQQQEQQQQHFASFNWILLSLSMIIFAIADSSFAYFSAFNITTVQNEVWISDMLYNTAYLTLAAALIRYSDFFILTAKYPYTSSKSL